MSVRGAPLWAYAATALAVALFVSLGTWQAERGRTKQRLQAELTQRSAPALTLTAGAPAPAPLTARRATATGVYLADRQLLQDGQSHAQRPGQHVWTPLQLDDGARVLVNRGWVPLGATDLAPPGGEVTVSGFWRDLPEPALRLGAAPSCEPNPGFPALVLYPDLAEVRCLVGEAVLAGLLLLDPDLPGGYARHWGDFGFPPERHFAYAFQWFALAVAAVAVFFVVRRKYRS